MVNLLMVVHGHQPVGNFEQVIEEAYNKSYLPFVEVLKRHPAIKLAMHFSGYLLEWLKEKHPEYIDTVRGLVKDGRVEIFSGGFYEPILTLVSQVDGRKQINLLSRTVEKYFSHKPSGGWVAERVWEPKLPQILSEAGLQYSVIDDSHFYLNATGAGGAAAADSLSGYYLTEEAGHRFAIFPGSEKLRYYLPFKLPEETINYLKARAYRRDEEITVSYGDDIEKLGLWPGTYQWVYKENWLDNFFSALEQNSSWLKTLTFQEYFASRKATSRVYLPCACYSEMMEWSKGYYRNFLVKYPEANYMHKKMFFLSGRVKEKAAALKKTSADMEAAQRHVFMAQANDAYWHGVFGGLYLYHLRSAIYSHLLKAQEILDKADNIQKTAKVEVLDFDLDDRAEIIVNTEFLNLDFRPEAGAALSCLGFKPKSCNLIDTLSRKPEAYHQKLRESLRQEKAQGEGQPASIHDVFQVKEAGMGNLLFYDRFPRYGWQDHFLPPETIHEDLIKSRYLESGDFIDGSYKYEIKKPTAEAEIRFTRDGRVGQLGVGLSKSMKTRKNGLEGDFTIKNLDAKNTLDVIFASEFNLSVMDRELADKKQLKALNELRINDSWHNLALQFSWMNKTNLWVFPVETISGSESGIERTYQELCCFFWWRINLAPGSKWKNSFNLTIG